MEENKNMNNTNEAKIEKVSARQMRKELKAQKKAERAEAKAAKKAAKAEKPSIIEKGKTWVDDHRGLVAGVATGAVLVVGTMIGVAKAKSRSGSDEVYDPDFEDEPGEGSFDSDPCEESEEDAVNEE